MEVSDFVRLYLPKSVYANLESHFCRPTSTTDLVNAAECVHMSMFCVMFGAVIVLWIKLLRWALSYSSADFAMLITTRKT